ncbi:MAG: Gfo/Idh/MocA family oxidoreductase, partial [Aliifodinibius sp.]|nr:Gfo/Idh/MocA family oxidoreductase [Fodinibius sp.]
MRFGLIGCGGIGQLRAEALKKLPEAELTIVCDIDPSLVEEMVRKFGAKKAKDWQALVSEENLDAVIVSTPPHLHAEMCIAALDAGKHVLCEKPLAKNISECQDMVATAKTTGCFLATGFNYRFYPSMIKARQLLDSGIIGPLDHIRSYAGYSAREHGQEWLHDEKIMGGGALRDNGIHLIDLTCYFLNDVTEVKGFSSNSVWQFPGCEDNGFALIRNRRGSVAILQASWNEWRGYRMLVEIYGKLGCIRAYCFPMFVQVIWS